MSKAQWVSIVRHEVATMAFVLAGLIVVLVV